MRVVHNWLACWLVLLGVLLVLAVRPSMGQTTGPATQSGPQALKGTKFTWLILNNVNRFYSTAVDVNGKRYNAFEEGSGVDSKPIPFKEGENQIKIVFVPKPDAKRRRVSLRLLLGAQMLPDAEATLTLVECRAEEGFEESNITVTFAGGQPGKMKIETKNWEDAEHKHLCYQMTADGDAYAADYEHCKTLMWTAEGKLFSESVEEQGKLVTAKDYKRDGSVGAEVKEGNGVRREFYESGAVSEESPYTKGLIEGDVKTFRENGKIAKSTRYSAGQAEGECREYDEQGQVRVSGNFKGGEMEGTWIRYDAKGKESARSEFKGGELIQGKDGFE